VLLIFIKNLRDKRPCRLFRRLLILTDHHPGATTLIADYIAGTGKVLPQPDANVQSLGRQLRIIY
jgi:hypothetical protein